MLQDHVKTVCIPVRISNGQIEFLNGGSLKDIFDDSTAELIISVQAVKNRELLDSLNQETDVLFLPKTSTLLFPVNTKKAPTELRKFIQHPRHNPLSKGCVEAVLQDDLYLHLRGTKNPILKDCRVIIPSLIETANSINHAYSRISTAFEPHRRSHTGNVFNLVHYQEPNTKYWQTLGSLRDQIINAPHATKPPQPQPLLYED